MLESQTIVKENCRICGGALHEVLDLGEFALSDFVKDEADEIRVPLTLVSCEKCSLVQLRHTVPRDKLYRMYWYHSGLNPSMVESLRDVVQSIQARVVFEAGDVVIDVGANDGTLLSLYSPSLNLVRIGFDPARNLAETATRRCDIFVNDFFETSEVEIPMARVITSIAMFYDLDDPRPFVQRVKNVLRHDGIWVVQMTDLVRMLKANAFDNVCHEHLCYYSLRQLSNLLEQYSLEIFDVSFNDVNGGSLRAYVAHRGARRVDGSVMLALEDEEMVLADDGLARFAERVQDARTRVVAFVERMRSEGKRVHALGASTKGNTLLQYFGLGPEQIECAAEVNPDKFGLRTAGSRIPIVSQDESLASKPDAYLVLPWHFLSFFLSKFAGYLHAGGMLVAPLPDPTLYMAEILEEGGFTTVIRRLRA